MFFVRLLLMVICVGLAWIFVSSRMYGEPSPFGPYMSWTLVSTSFLAGWASIRLHSVWERRATAYGFLFGTALGVLALVSGVLAGVFFSDKNLSPLVGFFVWGPVGFVIGTIIGVAFGFYQTVKGSPSAPPV